MRNLESFTANKEKKYYEYLASPLLQREITILIRYFFYHLLTVKFICIIKTKKKIILIQKLNKILF